MDFQRTPGPIGDPFLDTVHRRHPDVDIVVLPDPRADAGTPVAVLPVDADTARVERADAGTRLTALWRALHEDPEAADPARVAARLAPGPVAGTVVATAQATTTVDPEDPRRPPDAVPTRRRPRRLGGRAPARAGASSWSPPRDGASVRATYAAPTGVLVVVLTGPPLGVGAERRARAGRGGLRWSSCPSASASPPGRGTSRTSTSPPRPG